MRVPQKFVTAGVLASLMSAASADSGFLDDYSKLAKQPSATGTELLYVAPGAFDRMAKYKGVMVDQPEVLISPDSDYRGAKPDDLKAVAELMREVIGQKLMDGGYNVVDQPGPGILYLRVGLTDLYLKREKRNALGYLPVGFVVKAAKDAVESMMKNYDIIEMTFEAETRDSQTNEQLSALVVQRGARKAAGQKEQRMDFGEFRDTIGMYASRLRCRLDNAKLPADQRVDCLAQK